MLGRVIPFEALHKPPGFGGREGFVERGLDVGVEIVLNQSDFPGAREEDVRQVFENLGVIDGFAMVRDLDMAKAFQRREQHKEVGGPVSLVFVINTLRLPRLHWNRRSRLGNELLRGLVQTDERYVRIVRSRIDVEHLFHRRYESAVRLRRNDPLLFAVRLKRVFFRTRPIVLSLACSTMPSSTTLSSRSRSVQRARPSGGVEQASATSRASFSPSKMGVIAGAARSLRESTASRLSSTNCWRTRVTMDLFVSKASMISPSLQFSPCAGIGLEQDPGFQKPLGGAFSLVDQGLQMMAFCFAQFDDVFLCPDFPGGHGLDPRFGSSGRHARQPDMPNPTRPPLEIPFRRPDSICRA